MALWTGLLVAFHYAVWPWLPGQRGTSRTIIVYGFSILGDVMNRLIFPAFQDEWRKRWASTSRWSRPSPVRAR